MHSFVRHQATIPGEAGPGTGHQSDPAGYLNTDETEVPIIDSNLPTIGTPSPTLLRYQVLGRAPCSDLIPPEARSARYWDAPCSYLARIGCSAKMLSICLKDSSICYLDAQHMLFRFQHILFRCSAYSVWMLRICSLDAPGLPYISSTWGSAPASPSWAHFPPSLSVEKLVLAVELEQHRSRDILSDI